MLPAQRMAKRIKLVTDVADHVVRGVHSASISRTPAAVQLWEPRSKHSWPCPRAGMCMGAIPMVEIELKCQGSVRSRTKHVSEGECEPPCGAGRYTVLEGGISRIVSEACAVA